MATHKKQHFVPQCYVKAWCDPMTPPEQEPYVWRFNKDGSDPRRKAPENIFHETDLYTIHLPDGGRDLTLEHGLASLESAFVTIRDATLSQQKEPTPEERGLLCAFIAAAHARTPRQRDHLGGQWGKVLEKMDRMREWAKTATPEQKQAAAGLSSGTGSRLGYEDVKRMAEKPMETLLLTQIRVETGLLARLDFAVIEADPACSFITSDNPCVWFDPEWHTRAPFYQGPALMYESIEITLPVSPRQLILLSRRGKSGYLAAGERATEEFNRRTCFHCADHFVVNTSATKPIWFDRGTEPKNSWRKQHAAKSTLSDNQE